MTGVVEGLGAIERLKLPGMVWKGSTCEVVEGLGAIERLKPRFCISYPSFTPLL